MASSARVAEKFASLALARALFWRAAILAGEAGATCLDAESAKVDTNPARQGDMTPAVGSLPVCLKRGVAILEAHDDVLKSLDGQL